MTRTQLQRIRRTTGEMVQLVSLLLVLAAQGIDTPRGRLVVPDGRLCPRAKLDLHIRAGSRRTLRR